MAAWALMLLATALPAWAQPSVRGFDAYLDRVELGTVDTSSEAAGMAALADLRRLLPAGDAVRALRLDAVACRIHKNSTDGAVLHARIRDGLQRAQRLGDTHARIGFHLCAGHEHIDHGALQDAVDEANQALRLASAPGLWRMRSNALSLRAHVESLRGAQAAALLDLLDEQALYQQHGEEGLATAALSNIGIAYRRMGLYQQAERHLAEVERYTRNHAYPTARMVSLMQLGFLEENRGNLPEAQAWFERALSYAREAGMRPSEGQALMNIADMQARRGQLEPARETLQAARRLLASTDTLAGALGNVEQVEGEMALGGGRGEAALAHFRRAADIFRQHGNQRYEADALQRLADVHRQRGEFAAALDAREREMAMREALTRRMRLEQSQLLGQQFDEARRELENIRLQREADAQRRLLAEARQQGRLRTALLALMAVLMMLIVGLQLQTRRRLRLAQHDARTDSLTGVSSRRHALRMLSDNLLRFHHHRDPFCVLAIDVDHFKSINDAHGHAAGDVVLARIAAACRAQMRAGDVLGRIGGEEFLAVLSSTTLHHAQQLAERLRTGIADLPLDDVVPGLRATVSIGVAQVHDHDQRPEPLLARADAALYRAKEEGRNRVETASPLASVA